LRSPQAERRFAELPVPVVNVSNTAMEAKVSRVTQDDETVGRLAAELLIGCGCRTFGFWGQAGGSYSAQRLAGFRAGIAAAGYGDVRVTVTHETEWSYPRIRTWLEALPPRVGVFGVLDMFALALIRAAKELGRRVPEDVAVLGAGDDHFWVEFESVPLSSVRLPAKKIGYQAAALLDRLISRSKRTIEVERLPVSEIAVRRSTDILHVEDEAVAKAARFIRQHATENPYVNDIARAAGISLSALQTRFQKVIGRSLVTEVRRVRLSRAQELLADTELPMSLVAERCGFPNSQQFSVLFREGTGYTPRAYRRRFRTESPAL
jgi:LacI family transcriptional regulator